MFLLTFVFLLSFSNFCFSAGYPVRTIDSKVEYASFTLNGLPVWTTAERDQMVAVSSLGLTTNDFVSVSVPQIEKDIIAELNSENKSISRSKAIEEIAKRKSISFNLEKAMETKKSITAYNDLHKETGLNVQSSTETLKIKFDKYKERSIK